MKHFLSLAILVIFSYVTLSQNVPDTAKTTQSIKANLPKINRNEFSFAWGTPSVKKIDADEKSTGFLTLGIYAYTEASSNGSFTFAYNHITASQKISFGLRYSQENLKISHYYGAFSNKAPESETWNIKAFMANLTWHYLRRNYFRMYSGAALGFSSIQDEDSDDKEKSAAFQITFVGLAFGSSLGGTLEAGYGYEGVFKAGVFFRF